MNAGIRAWAVLACAVTPALAAPPNAQSEGSRVHASGIPTPSAAAIAWLATFDDAAAAGAQRTLDDRAGG